MFGRFGVWEVILILLVVLLIFGPKRIPSLARSIGKGLREFRKASNDLKEAVDEMDAADTHGGQQSGRNTAAVTGNSAGAAGDAPALPAADNQQPEQELEPDLDTKLREKLNMMSFGGSSAGGFSLGQSSSLGSNSTGFGGKAADTAPAPVAEASQEAGSRSDGWEVADGKKEKSEAEQG